MAYFAKSGTELDRKLLKRPDEFYSHVRSWFEKFSQNTKQMGIAFGVFLIITAGIGVYLNQKDAKETRAQNQLFLAQKTLAESLKKLAAAEKKPETPSEEKANAKTNAKTKEPSPEEILFKKVDVDSTFTETIQKMKTVAQDFPGTHAAYEALSTLGTLYYRHGHAEKSIDWFLKASQEASGSFEKALALLSLAYAYENSGKYSEALTYFEKALNTGEKSVRGDALLSMARNHESMKAKDKAKTLYDQVISEMPETEFSKHAELYKSLIE